MSKNIVCYLTGAPATGKSSLCEAISQRCENVKVFSYSKELRNYINEKQPTATIDENLVRKESSKIITKDDVDAVDKLLVDFIKINRKHHSVIIDSHAVTKEAFGFRVTPFSTEILAACNPDKIVCLYANPNVISDRIFKDPEGRPLPNIYELEFHNQTQAAVAIQYSITLGKACYLLDSDLPLEELISRFLRITSMNSIV